MGAFMCFGTVKMCAGCQHGIGSEVVHLIRDPN
jgi:hypothetical protein